MIKSTIQLLEDHRAESLSVSQIVKTGNLSRQVFYEHFADRDALLYAAGVQMLQPAIDWSREVAEGGVRPNHLVEHLFSVIEPYRNALRTLCDGPVHWRLHSYGVEKIEPYLRAELSEILEKNNVGDEITEEHLAVTTEFVACGVIAQFTDAVRDGRSAEQARDVMRKIRETINVITYDAP